VLGVAVLNFLVDYLFTLTISGGVLPSVLDLQTFVSLVFWIIFDIAVIISRKMLKKEKVRIK
jgi:hypothetical protein